MRLCVSGAQSEELSATIRSQSEPFFSPRHCVHFHPYARRIFDASLSTGPPGDRGALQCRWNAIATQPIGLVPFQARGILQVAEEQSRTRGDQSGGITNQPQCRFLWHSRSPSARSPSSPPPSFTQSPSPPRSLVRDGQTRPHRPRLVASRSTCPPPSPPPREQLYNRYCSSKHTTVINTHTSINEHTSLTPSPSRAAVAAAQLLGRSAVPRDLMRWRERSVHCTPSRSQLPHSKLPYF